MGTNIAYAQIYCTVDEVIGDLGLTGDEAMLLSRIRSASRHILNVIGNFVPISDTREFFAGGGMKLEIDALLAATVVTDDVTVIAASGYRMHPLNQAWLNGPYTWLEKAWSDGSSAWQDSNLTNGPNSVLNNNPRLAWSTNGVAVAGKWGLYEELSDLGIVATQLVGAKSLVVTDGSLLSPGMVLSIEGEQELVTAGNGGPGSADGTVASSQLTATIAADVEVVGVTNGAEFKTGEVFRCEFEDFKIRKIAGNALLCSRGWNGSTKNTHVTGSAIYIYRTFTVSRAMNGTVAAGHTSAAVSRFVIPEDVNWLVREVAGLMRMKAKVNFAAKSGNAELGEAFYFNEFPKQIEVIKGNYKLP
jgi:hypothetical protein